MHEIFPFTTYSTPEKFEQPIAPPVSERGFWIWKRTEFRLIIPYTFTWGRYADRRINIPAGFEWDGSSTPHWAALFGHTPVSMAFAASLVHDYLCGYDYKPPSGTYQVKIGGEWVDDPSKWPGLQVHELYRYMSVLGGVSPGKALTQKAAVVLWPPIWK